MAHNLSENKMFYYGEVPWHGLGVKLNNPATAQEAICASGLDFDVALHPMWYINAETGNRQEIPFGKVVQRLDTRKFLGTVGNSYTVVQNREAFSFFDEIVGEGEAIYHTAGALGDGEQIWILAKLPDSIHVTDADCIDKYLLLMNSHNGRSSLRIFFTPVRVVCQNTLLMAMRQQINAVVIRHTGKVMKKASEARNLLGIVGEFYNEFGEVATRMVNHKMRPETLRIYFSRAISNENEIKGTDLAKSRLREFNRLFEEGKGNQLPKVRGSLWAAMNSITEYVDHYQDTKNRLKNAWFGVGSKMKDRAYAEALKVII